MKKSRRKSLERLLRTSSLFALCALSVSCAGLQQNLPSPSEVADASKKKDAICHFARVWEATDPSLARIVEMCDEDATLKEIAGAYAGCTPSK